MFPESYQKWMCLHTDSNGEYRCIDAEGRQSSFSALPAYNSLTQTHYRVLGLPENYKLITDLFQRLCKKEEESCLHVGSFRVCGSLNDSTDEVLRSISKLDVHKRLCNTWHAVTSKTFNTYLLLWLYEEQSFSKVVQEIFQQHSLAKHFEFAGIPPHYAIQLMSMIVDPRWYLSVKAPMRMQPFESYFGINSKNFKSVPDKGLDSHISMALARKKFLLDTVKVTKSGSFVRSAKTQRQSCKILIGYIVRNWLNLLGFEDCFVPEKFFANFSYLCKEYRHRFGKS